MMTQLRIDRKNYWSLDVAKFMCALMIISAHFASEWGNFPSTVDYAFSIYVIAVPFFFCCGGFLFFKKVKSFGTTKEQNWYLLKYQKRLWIMYGIWTLVYLPFQIYDWITNYDFMERFLAFIHRALVIQTYATIWFLPALAVGIVCTYFLVRKLSKIQLVIIAALLYVFGALGHTYNFLLEGTFLESFFDGYLWVFKTSRNGVFNAIPFVLIGYFISKKDITPSIRGIIKYGTSSIVFLALLAIESFLLKAKFNVSGMDIGIFIVPFTYCFIMTMLNIELKEHALWLWCRKLSLGIFVSQRLFLSSLPILFPEFFRMLYKTNSWLGLIIVISATVIFSILIVHGSKRFKFLKYFM